MSGKRQAWRVSPLAPSPPHAPAGHSMAAACLVAATATIATATAATAAARGCVAAHLRELLGRLLVRFAHDVDEFTRQPRMLRREERVRHTIAASTTCVPPPPPTSPRRGRADISCRSRASARLSRAPARTRASDAVHVVLDAVGEIVVDHKRNVLDICDPFVQTRSPWPPPKIKYK